MGGWEFIVANINDGYLGLDGKSFVLTMAWILVSSCQALIFFFKVLFSKAAETKIRQLAKEEKDDEKREAAKMLENMIDMINQVKTERTEPRCWQG